MGNPLIGAIKKETNKARTTNGMKAKVSTLNDCVDLFFNIGAMRGRDILPQFAKAFADDNEVALRIALWSRDAREGAGERQHFRNILKKVAIQDYKLAERLLVKAPELGRWDDVLAVHGTAAWPFAVEMIRKALTDGDGLCAKWLPRKGKVAVQLTKDLGLSPKGYRKSIVGLTNVVETQMCSKEWGSIDYNKVPSVAASRYHKAFSRNDSARYEKYIISLEKGEKGAKINAGAVYPYTVVQALNSGNARVANQQWAALPDFVPEGKSFLPVVDVSGSMGCPAGGYGSNSGVTCMDVAISLGLYLSERNKSAFKDAFITFSESPKLEVVSGDLQTRYRQMLRSDWGMNTNLEKVFSLILRSAVKGKVAQEDMPDCIIIMSDMQFDGCVSGKDTTTIKMIKDKYKEAGYKVPDVVFWNLNASGNVPVTANKAGVALVSGFSPSIVSNVLKAENMSPTSIMMSTVMQDRYAF